MGLKLSASGDNTVRVQKDILLAACQVSTSPWRFARHLGEMEGKSRLSPQSKVSDE